MGVTALYESTNLRSTQPLECESINAVRKWWEIGRIGVAEGGLRYDRLLVHHRRYAVDRYANTLLAYLRMRSKGCGLWVLDPLPDLVKR